VEAENQYEEYRDFHSFKLVPHYKGRTMRVSENKGLGRMVGPKREEITGQIKLYTKRILHI
jgi:hypothetical protein